MKRMKPGLLAWVVVVAMGCGGASSEALSGGEVLGDASRELAGCTALCDSGSVSCTGATCSAVDYHGVTCGGTFYACPPPPNPSCPYESCSPYSGQACWSPGASVTCCDAAGGRNVCACNGGSWMCMAVDA